MATELGIKRNYGMLLWANVVSALMAFASIAITARVLSVEEFGLLVLIQAYTAIIAQLAGFRTWEPLIKYGADALELKDAPSFAAIIRTSFWVDIVTAIAGWLLALVAARILSDFMDWNESTFHLVVIYSLVILLNVSGFATGVLRLFDRYKQIATQQIAFQIVRLLLLMFCWIFSLDLVTVVLCWVISEIFAYLLLLILGVRELGKQHVSVMGRVKRFEKRRSYLSFLLANNLNSSIRMISREIDVIVVGVFVGKAGAGIYKLAVQMASVISKLTDPLHVLLLPVFSKLKAAGEIPEIRRIVIKITTIIMVVFIAGYVLALKFGQPIVNALFGVDYQKAFEIFIIYLIAIGLACLLLCVIPVMQAFGKAVLCLKVQAKATAGYLIALIPLCYFFGLEGAAVAYIIFYLLWTLLIRAQFLNVLR